MGAVLVTPDPPHVAVSDEDRARFEALVGGHLDGLYSSALRLTRNRTAAEDLVQDTFLKAWRSFRTFQDGTNARAWLYKILMNAYIDGYAGPRACPRRWTRTTSATSTCTPRHRKVRSTARRATPRRSCSRT